MEIDINLKDVLETTYANDTTCSSSVITKYIKEPIPYSKFFNENLMNNQPCIFGDWLTKEWKLNKEWVLESGEINYDYLISNFGNAAVPVANCNEKYYNSQRKKEYLLKNYFEFITKNREIERKECLYLKDWHFVHAYPNYDGYDVPKYFASDWLNEFWSCFETKEDDYRFVYIGPKGSWTPFHADVFRSFSWSSNISGRKKWVLFPPLEENSLKDNLGNLIYDLESPDIRDEQKFPNINLVKGKLEVYQEKGETIFVPSSWHHQVWNLEDTISVNHNWINGTNILVVWDFLQTSLQEVEKAIEDCVGMEGWSQQCQLILKASHGMDYLEYFKFLKVIAQRRIQYLSGDETISSYSCWRLGRDHVLFDVHMLKMCLQKLMDESHSDKNDIYGDDDHPNDLLEQLEQFL